MPTGPVDRKYRPKPGQVGKLPAKPPARNMCSPKNALTVGKGGKKYV